jgi:hypothetical protein
MTAFNAVRFRVKPERDQDFLNAHDNIGQRGQVYSKPISLRLATALIASSLSGKTWTLASRRGLI